FTGGARQLAFSTERRTNVYDASGKLVDQLRTVGNEGEPFYLGEGLVAIVHDTSYFGATSPIYGARSRFEVGHSIGSLSYTTTLVDVRRYFMPVKPYTIAVRGLQYSRWGRDGEHEKLAPLYAGYPELVRGYGLGSFDVRDCDVVGAGGQCAIFNNLRGSGVAVANLEVRAPLVGIFQDHLDYGPRPTDLSMLF